MNLKISENRMPQRAFYIPENSMTTLNGQWDFKFYEYGFEADYIKKLGIRLKFLLAGKLSDMNHRIIQI